MKKNYNWVEPTLRYLILVIAFAGAVLISEQGHASGAPQNVPQTPLNQRVVSNFKIVNEGSHYRLDVVGQVGVGSFAQVVKQIPHLNKHRTLVIHIDSPGGSAGTTLDLLNALSDFDGNIVTINDGHAYSAGALIFLIGDQRIMKPLSTLLFHSVQSQYCGPINRKILTEIENDVDNFNSVQRGYIVQQVGAEVANILLDDHNENNMITYGRAKELGIIS